MDQIHEREQQNAREPLPHGNGALVEACWDRLGPVEDEGGGEAIDSDWRIISFEQLQDAMRDAATAAVRAYHESAPEQAEGPMTETPPMDPRVQQLVDETLCTGTAGALAQSLKVMGQQLAYDGHEGWGVVARRAEQFVRAMHMQVTRFLRQPDCHLRHPSLGFDLLAAHVDVADVGRVMVHCTDTDGNGWHQFPLEDLNPAGPVDDAVRSMVGTMVQAFVLNQIDQAKERGDLPVVRDDTVGDVAFVRDPEHPQRLPVAYVAEGHELDANRRLVVGVDAARPGGDQTAEVVASRDADGNVTVHHLQVHDEYVMGEDGPHAEAVGFDAPEGDQAFGQNGS